MYREICSKYAPDKDNLICILHEIQNSHPQHYISEEAVQTVAEYLGVPANHIYGVLTFYTMYSTKPPVRISALLHQGLRKHPA